MIARLVRIGAATLPLLVIAGAGAVAQTASPSPRPSPSAVPTPSAFAARAHANVSVVAQGTTYAGAVQLAVAQRDELTRVDVLSIKSDSFPVPPITATVVIDHRANTVTLWSDNTKQYRVQQLIPRAAGSPTPRAAASAGPSASPRPRRVGGTSPFAKLEVLDVSLRLTGHGTTAGLATTGIAFDLQVRNRGDRASSHVTATTQLADDYVAFPVTVDLSIEPGMAPFGAKLSYAVDSLTRGLPPATSFQIPAGYTEATSLMGVIFSSKR